MDAIALRKLLAAQSEDTLRMMNEEVVAEIRKRRSLRESKATRAIEVGGQYQFYSEKYGRTVRIRVTKVNTVTVHGVEIEATGRIGYVTWKVSPSVLKPVTSEALAA